MTEYRYRVWPTNTGRWAWETQRRPAPRQGDLQYEFWSALTEGDGAADEQTAIALAQADIEYERQILDQREASADARAKQPWRTA